MTIERLVLGPMGANCYLIGDKERVIIIDPADDAQGIFANIRGRKVEYILLTHTHVDHISALTEVKEEYPNAILGVHHEEVSYLSNPDKNLSQFLGNPVVYTKTPELKLTHQQTIPFLDTEIQVIHTPGHTPGGCCFLIKDNLFSGDTLFQMSIGRTDFPGGSYTQIIDSIKERLLILPSDTKIFPGHMGESTIEAEKKGNPFLN